MVCFVQIGANTLAVDMEESRWERVMVADCFVEKKGRGESEMVVLIREIEALDCKLW